MTTSAELRSAPEPLSLCAGFFAWAAELPDRPALEVQERTLTYAELARQARRLAAALAKHAPEPDPPLAAVLAHRTPTAFAGVLGALASGRGYMPLNPAYPLARTRAMLERSSCRAIIVDSGARAVVDGIVAGAEHELLLLLPDEEDGGDLARRWAPHRVLGSRELPDGGDFELPPVRASDPAYLLFTSGSTGTPKGVLVTRANVRAFLDAASSRYEITPLDRLSQTFNLTFDLSAFDMFVAWEHGACVCCPSDKSLLNPAEFIRRSRLSVWFSVPSVALLMRRLAVLKPGAFPTLRWSLFCGEALPVDVARDWALAAPNSTVENLYGPTEATIACTAYRWHRNSVEDSEVGIVPIGYPFRGMSARVVDEQLRDVRPGDSGELILSGQQVVPGYWRDDEATSRSFVSVGGTVYYRTGDRARHPRGDGPLRFMGRLDHQVKILGHRVELGEIEAVIREETGVDAVVAVGWPRTPAGAAGVAAFVADTNVDSVALRKRLTARLPGYMIPRELRLVSELPRNANGKWDRGALITSLEDSS